jgi:hypothetical protein
VRYVPAHYHGATRGESSINLIVVHSDEGAESSTNAEGTASYFAGDMGGRAASAHVVVDNDSEITCVPDNVIAYGAAHANSNGLHLEQAGTAHQSAEQWRDPYSTAVCLRAGAQIARWCKAHPQIKPVFLSAAMLASGARNGVTTHAEVSKAWPSTGHWDPGPNYPIHDVLAIAASVLYHPAGQVTTPPPTPQSPQAVDYAALRRGMAGSYAASWKQLGDHDMDPTSTPRGLDVALLQNSLNLATHANLVVDGQYGGTTQTAVQNFQNWLNAIRAGTITYPPEFPTAVKDFTRFYLIAFLDQVAAGAA